MFHGKLLIFFTKRTLIMVSLGFVAYIDALLLYAYVKMDEILFGVVVKNKHPGAFCGLLVGDYYHNRVGHTK